MMQSSVHSVDAAMPAPGKLFGVGIGPGDPRYLTLRAAEVLRTVPIVFTVASPNSVYSISRAAVQSLAPLAGEIRELTFSMSRDPEVRNAQICAHAATILAELRAGRDCAFATLGDAMTYSTFGYVLEPIRAALPALELEVVPGVTSFATLAAKAGQVLVENGASLRVVPAFRRAAADSLELPPDSTTVLLKTYHSRDALLDRLATEENLEIVYGERLGLEKEFISRDLAAVRARPDEYLSLFMVKKKA